LLKLWRRYYDHNNYHDYYNYHDNDYDSRAYHHDYSSGHDYDYHDNHGSSIYS
jgi:hypothetical protein